MYLCMASVSVDVTFHRKGEGLTLVVKFLEMMDLVLILVIAMMSWSGLKQGNR